MGFQLSPGVNVSEIDLTTIVPSVSTTAGAIAGYFPWGPVGQITLVDSEITLATTFTGSQTTGPNDDSAVDFFSAANFLAYGNALNVVRVVGAHANNAITNSESVAIQIPNKSIFEEVYLHADNEDVFGPFVARYPGALGNSILVSVADSATYSSWAYKGYFPSAPGTSAYAASVGGSHDEMHIIVVDHGGLITGTKGYILETFGFVSKASDALLNGTTNYYKQVIFNNSKFVYATDPVDYANTSMSWDSTAANTAFVTLSANSTVTMTEGADAVPTDGNYMTGYGLFQNKETVDISLIISSGADTTVQDYIITDIAETRADCVAFVSPPSSAVINQSGSESANITEWLGLLSVSSSYAVADSGWKYQYDKYNSKYRWIPLNADIAGLCVHTDSVRDPWFSPAGFNRGAIKNCIKLAWNPSKTYRDTLYSQGVNPVVSFPGQGTVLFGDKTLQSKPSAFDRINVRRLFIVLEKAISTAAQYSLFELNNDSTRNQFVNTVSPFLRTVQGRQGITDFKVVCDTTNNTPQVIDSNQFVGDIYIKPARSINFIQLNFVAVATGVDFTTVVGSV